MNADHEEAVEFAKHSKRENRVYVGNLSYDVKYRDLIEFMRGGGWGKFQISFIFRCGLAWLGSGKWRGPGRGRGQCVHERETVRTRGESCGRAFELLPRFVAL